MADPTDAGSAQPPEDPSPLADLRALAGAARREFERDGVAAASPDESASMLEQPGDQIDRYTLVERIGEGGTGSVWSARQETPVQRRVALKVIRLGLESPEVLARFSDEQRSLALMEHPSIAAMLDGGTTPRGRPYFVMEFIDGPDLLTYCDAQRLGLNERLRLFARITSAIEHAHQKGVVHRDIKPSNILVPEVNGAPFPKVIDFGIARSSEEDEEARTRWTALQSPMGTLSYMSPEQAGLVNQDVDTRADVYSLGALLYQLLTGEVPLEAGGGTGSNLETTLRDLRQKDPERPSTRVARAGDTGSRMAAKLGLSRARLRDVLAQDLDWIVLKALDKDRARRYPSATALGADVQAFLAGDVVEARQPTWRYRATKFVRRNRIAVTAGALTFTVAFAGAAGTGYGLWKSLASNRELQEANRMAKRELIRARESKELLSDMLTSVAPKVARGKDTELLLGILDRTSERLKSGAVGDPEVARDLDYDIGRSYSALGRFEDGLEHVERARIASAEMYGEESAIALRMLTGKALSLRQLERIEASEDAYRAALAGLQKLHGTESPDHPDILRAQIGLGQLLHRSGRLDEARELLTAGVEAERRVLSDEERAESSGLIALATLNFFSHSDIEGAIAQFEEALQLAEEHLDEDHPQALRALEHLSQIYALAGSSDAAIERGESLLERFERVYGA
ncbi:MAG: serine/threonine-protein kinase, partial [Planctomycetota bacterium]